MSATSANIFNSLILGYIIAFFSKAGLFPRLAAGATLGELSAELNFEPRRLQTILDSAQTMGVIKEDRGSFHLTKLGIELERNRGFFTWAIGGYSPLLESMDNFLTAPGASWRPFVRGDYVAIGSDEANQGLMKSIFDRVIDKLPAACVADLGCGNAGRLVELLRRRPELRGVGVDIDAGAIEVATRNRDDHGLSGRLQLSVANVLDTITEPPQFPDADLVMSFMMLHDLFNIDWLQDGELFRLMKAAFPSAKRFVFADTCRNERSHDFDSMPIFTMGYELIHSLRGIKTFPLSYYEEQFAKGGLKLVDRHDFGVPNTYLFVLEA